jgi:hypothetical protein
MARQRTSIPADGNRGPWRDAKTGAESITRNTSAFHAHPRARSNCRRFPQRKLEARQIVGIEEESTCINAGFGNLEKWLGGSGHLKQRSALREVFTDESKKTLEAATLVLHVFAELSVAKVFELRPGDGKFGDHGGSDLDGVALSLEQRV